MVLAVLASGLLGGWLVFEIAGVRLAPAPPSKTVEEPPGEAEPAGGLVSPPRLPVPDSAAQPQRDSLPPSVPGTGRLVVSMRHPASGLAWEARVGVRDASGARVATLVLTSADTSSELPCEPGTFELALESPVSPALGTLPRRVVIERGKTESVELALVPLRRPSGRLVGEGERGVEDVRVALEHDALAVAETRSGADGTFAFPQLPEGDYALVVGDPLGPLVPRRILRIDAELGELELRIPALLELEVRVVDGNGLSVAGAEVEGVGEKGGRVAGVTDFAGSLRATQLPPGNYRIFARHPERGRGNCIFVLESASAVEIRLLNGPPPR